MEDFSRVKKYQKLRESIQEDVDKPVISPALASFAKRLGQIDSQYVDMQVSNSDHSPLHGRNEAYQNFQNEEPISTFDSSYLDQFIDEVKKYNIKEGTRKTENTLTNVLKSVSDQEKNPSFLVQKKLVQDKPFTNQKIDSTISSQVAELMQEDDDYVFIEESEEALFNQELMQRTDKISAQLDEYEIELASMNQSVTKTSQLMNYLIALMILAIISILAAGIWWILFTKGIL